MRRRTLLTLTGTAMAGTVAGCLGDEETNGTLDVGGTDVPLVSTDQAYEWYSEGDLLVLDARSVSEWEAVRIVDAEPSPAADGLDEGDPTEAVDRGTRILTYCVCPHTLAGQRGASLIDDGFTDVHALDEGLQDWIEEGYPTEGEDVTSPTEGTTIPEPDYH